MLQREFQSKSCCVEVEGTTVPLLQGHSYSRSTQRPVIPSNISEVLRKCKTSTSKLPPPLKKTTHKPPPPLKKILPHERPFLF